MGCSMPDQAWNSDRAVPRLLEMGTEVTVFDVCRSSNGIKYIDRERKK